MTKTLPQLIYQYACASQEVGNLYGFRNGCAHDDRLCPSETEIAAKEQGRRDLWEQICTILGRDPDGPLTWEPRP